MAKKILSTILLMLIVVSFVVPSFGFSSSGTGKWVAGQYNSGIKTTDSNGIIIRRLTNYTTNEKITVFCTEFGVDSSTGVIETAQHIVPTDPLMKTACKIAYFGWYSRYGEYAVDGGILTEGFKQVKMDYVFTQQMIWEVLGQSRATFIDSNIQNQYNLFKNQINSNIENMQKKPSFCDSTITLDIGQTIILTDENGVLAEYTSIDKTIEGIRILHNKGENTITITVNNDCTLENYKISEEMMKSWGVIKESSKDNDTTIFFSFKDGVQDQLYSMHYNDPVTMSMNFKINLYGKLELSKMDTDKKLIDGAIFQINGPDNFSREITVTNGKITLDNLKKGTYTINEKVAPKGFLLDTNTYTVEVVPNQTTTQMILNKKPTGTFTLVKKNEDKTATLEGAQYRIWNNNGYDKNFTTDKNGRITLTGLELGTYNYKEIQAPFGYLIDSNTYSFEVKYKDQNTNIIFANAERTNIEPKGIIKITKNDNETGCASQGDATLENAVYNVYAKEDIYNIAKTKKFYSKGDLIATRTTNSKGETEEIIELPLGKYLVKEMKAPVGYLIDTKEYEVNLTYKDQNTEIITQSVISKDKVKEMKVHIYKTGIKESSGLVAGLPGAEFTIKLNSDVQKAYKQGYSYAEIWNGLDEVGNIVKVDDKRVKEAEKIAPVYEVIKTNQEGNAYTQEKLPYGKYIVKETKVPKNFIGAEDFTFVISQDESEIREIAQKVKHLVVNNEQPTGTLIIHKTIEKREYMDTSLINISNLSEIKFKLTAKEDVIDWADGSVVYKKGQEIGIYSLDENGDLKIEKLPIGIYEVQEVKTLDGLILDNTKYEVKFTQKDQMTPIYIQRKEIKNTTSLIEISKTNITGEKQLIGAKLTILDENNKIIDTWISTEKSHKIEGLTVGKTYILKEEIAPEGYTIAEDIKFTIDNKNEPQLIMMKDKQILIIQTGNERNYPFLVNSLVFSVSGLIFIIFKRI